MQILRVTLRLLAALSLVLVLTHWLSAGANTGWSMDRVPLQKFDEITEIEYTVYEERYVPGLDVIAIAATGAVLCFSLTFLPLLKTKPSP